MRAGGGRGERRVSREKPDKSELHDGDLQFAIVWLKGAHETYTNEKYGRKRL